MSKIEKARKIVRALHRSWPETLDITPRYAGCGTLAPGDVVSAWDRLSEDTLPLEVAHYPAVFHHALMAALAKRGTDGR